MLKVTGEGTATTCDGVARRDFLEVGALGAVGLSLPQLMAVEKGHHGKDNKNVIIIFNLGAPSQLDTWDMKPEAPMILSGLSARLTISVVVERTVSA